MEYGQLTNKVQYRSRYSEAVIIKFITAFFSIDISERKEGRSINNVHLLLIAFS